MGDPALERYRGVIPEWSAFLEASSRPEPTVFRLRRGGVAPAVVLERLADQGFRTRPLEGLPAMHQVEDGPYPLSSTVEHWLGLLYVQQASTGVAAPALGPRPGERVLDLCSAPGGKTTHLADLMEERGCLVASEISESRIRGLLGNVYRLGHTGIFTVAADGRGFPEGALFDRVLVDAPCSGEGTLRRSGRAPDPSASFRSHVTRTQSRLLERAVGLTRPGGTILYVTCTFAPEENEAIVDDALERLPVELESLDLPIPHAPGLTAFDGRSYDPRLEGAARIYPHHLDSGGLFLARLRRLGGGEAVAPNGPARTEGGPDGWAPVPLVFPGENVNAAEAEARIHAGVEEITERFGFDGDFDEVGWVMRGGRAWMHTLDAWPMPAWAKGEWRPISVGLRALDFDSRGRTRPSNDFLRWLANRVSERVLDVDRDALERLLRREAVPVTEDDRGPVALRYAGDVIGRGAVTVDGLKSEIPKARASDLRRCLKASGE